MRQSGRTATGKGPKRERHRSLADMQACIDALKAELAGAQEREIAAAEILQVINANPGNLAPVFDAILQKAHELCGAEIGSLGVFDGQYFRKVARHGYRGEVDAFLSQPYAPAPQHAPLFRGDTIHAPDVMTVSWGERTQLMHAWAKADGLRTWLEVPLWKDGTLLGSISAWRREARAFSPKEIALLQSFAAQAVIAMENARLLDETREALEQQTATAEVLQVINANPGNLAPVFDALLEKALAQCGGSYGSLLTFDGEFFHAVAYRGGNPEFLEWARQVGPMRAGPGTKMQRMVDGELVVHDADMADSDAYRSGDPVRRGLVDIGGFRTTLGVALRKDDVLVGIINLWRQEARPFTDKQIALLQSFAAQAVIAMENARLLDETREALEQQTATAEVLQVINSSPGDLAPVFAAMLEKALSLCEASLGMLYRYESETIHPLAVRGASGAAAQLSNQSVPIEPESTVGRLARGLAPFVHTPDVTDDEVFRSGAPSRRLFVELTGVRTALWVALRKDETLIGVFIVYRQEVRPFSDKQIALLQNFAAQAVIAMENARLLAELQQRTRDLEESLEYQTATSDVLKVISRSTFDLQPVLDAVCQTASQLCAADGAGIAVPEGEGYRYVSFFSLEETFSSFLRQHVFPIGRGSIAGRTLLEGRMTHIPDIAADPEYALPQTMELGKLRTLLGVPLLRDGTAIGTLTLTRQRVEPFTERQIELVRTFADQAAIAIGNTRLLTELRESLEQQQAIAEILEVINRSPGELQPVFDVLLQKAMELCRAAFGTMVVVDGDGGPARTVATRGVPEAYAEFRRRNPVPPTQRGMAGRIFGGAPFAHVIDVKDDELYRSGDPYRRALVDLGGAQTYLVVALRKDQELLGAISVYRQEVKPFTEKQIALLQSFAAQAVIAMDNARLLNEIRQRQAELRVTFDNMGDGVAMFDDELRLAAWNRNFQTLLDLPDDFLASRPNSAEFVRFLAERGEYGAVDVEAEVRRLVERAGMQWSAERTRPDGRIIEVRHNPVPSGGFVLIYGDVTERRRADEAIRSARDAAEKALGELKAAQASLIQAEKMASLGQLTAGIAHEIKNPLNFVNNFAGLSVDLLGELKETAGPAFEGLDEDERGDINETMGMLTQNLDKIAEHGRRADNIVKSMLEHSRGVSGERRAVDLNALLEEALNLAYHGARAQDASFNITMERELEPKLAPIELAPQEMTRVFLNLFGNGFYAATKRARESGDDSFRPTLTVATREDGEDVEVRVRDNGTGIPPEIREKLFQPFFTTKPTGEGTGLGLSISYDIVTQQHGGTITVESEPGQFTEFIVRLPRQQQPTTPGRAA